MGLPGNTRALVLVEDMSRQAKKVYRGNFFPY